MRLAVDRVPDRERVVVPPRVVLLPHFKVDVQAEVARIVPATTVDHVLAKQEDVPERDEDTHGLDGALGPLRRREVHDVKRARVHLRVWR